MSGEQSQDPEAVETQQAYNDPFIQWIADHLDGVEIVEMEASHEY